MMLFSTVKSPSIDADVFTTKPSTGDTDAVTEPEVILVWSKSKIASAGISNKFLPLPLNEEPLINDIAPLTNSEPVSCEPLSGANTTNPLLSLTCAKVEPDVIKSNSKSVNDSAGILNNPPPSPLNKEADNGTFTTISLGEITA